MTKAEELAAQAAEVKKRRDEERGIPYEELLLFLEPYAEHGDTVAEAQCYLTPLCLERLRDEKFTVESIPVKSGDEPAWRISWDAPAEKGTTIIDGKFWYGRETPNISVVGTDFGGVRGDWGSSTVHIPCDSGGEVEVIRGKDGFMSVATCLDGHSICIDITPAEAYLIYMALGGPERNDGEVLHDA